MTIQLGYVPFLKAEDIHYQTIQVGNYTVKVPDLTQSQLTNVCHQIKSARYHLQAYTINDIIDVIDHAIQILLDRTSKWRQLAEEILPQSTGYPFDIIKVGLTRYLMTFRKHQLHRFIAEDLPNPQILNQFIPNHKGGYTKAVSPALITHLWSGNIPGLPLWSFISSLLVKSGSICKLPHAEPFLASWFAEIIAEIDPVIAQCFAVIYWPGGETQLESIAIEQSDVILGYGNNDVLSAIAQRIPVTKRFLAYGEKVSLALIGNETLSPNKVEQVTRNIAREIANYDQQGCYSPQMIFIQQGGNYHPLQVAQMIAHQLQQLEQLFPVQSFNLQDSMTRSHWLQQEETQALLTDDIHVFKGAHASWIVTFHKQLTFLPSPLNRFVRIMPFTNITQLTQLLTPYRSYLQTVGIAAATEKMFQWSEALAQVGVCRFSSLETMTLPEAGWHHDGGFNLRDLLSFVDIEQPLLSSSEHFVDYEI